MKHRGSIKGIPNNLSGTIYEDNNQIIVFQNDSFQQHIANEPLGKFVFSNIEEFREWSKTQDWIESVRIEPGGFKKIPETKGEDDKQKLSETLQQKKRLKKAR